MFLDTTIIIELLQGDKRSKRIEKILALIKDEPLFVSVIQLGELSDWCISAKIDPLKPISQIKDIANIIPINEKIASEGAEIKHEMRKSSIKKFSLMDGLILASARSINQNLLTSDTDFRKAKDAIVIK